MEEFRGVCREALMANLHSGKRVSLQELSTEACARDLRMDVMQSILAEEERRLSAEQQGSSKLQAAPFPSDVLGDATPLVAPALQSSRGANLERDFESRRRSERSPDRRRRRDRRYEGGQELPAWQVDFEARLPGLGSSSSSAGLPGVQSGASGIGYHAAAVPALAPAMASPTVPAIASQFAQKLPMGASSLGDLPNVFLMEGFLNPGLNQSFYANPQSLVCGHPTYWDRDQQYFMYWEQQETRWVITPRISDNADMLLQAQSGMMKGIAFQYDTAAWQEFVGNKWHAVQVQMTRLVVQPSERSGPGAAQFLPSATKLATVQPAPPAKSQVSQSARLARTREAQPRQAAVDTVDVRGGFNNDKLNTTFFLDPSISVGGRSTYWDQHRRHFMYYQGELKRWAISCGKGGLDDAMKGGLRGLAYEVDKGEQAWSEFFEGQWLTVRPDLHKLSTGKRAPPVPPAVALQKAEASPPSPQTRKASPPPEWEPPVKLFSEAAAVLKPEGEILPEASEATAVSDTTSMPAPPEAALSVPEADGPPEPEKIEPLEPGKADEPLEPVKADPPVEPEKADGLLKPAAAPELEAEAESSESSDLSRSSPQPTKAKAKALPPEPTKSVPVPKKTPRKSQVKAAEEDKRKQDKQTRQMEKKERERMKENMLREKIRQEMQAKVAAQKASETIGDAVPSLPPGAAPVESVSTATDKPTTAAAKAKKHQRKDKKKKQKKSKEKKRKKRDEAEASSPPLEQPSEPSLPSRTRQPPWKRWKASVAANWPAWPAVWPPEASADAPERADADGKVMSSSGTGDSTPAAVTDMEAVEALPES